MKIIPMAFERTRFWVASETNPAGPPHLVDTDYDGAYGCSCHDHQCRERECKHIRAVKRFLSVHRNPQ